MDRRKFLCLSAVLLWSVCVGTWLIQLQGRSKGQTLVAPTGRQSIEPNVEADSSVVPEESRGVADFAEGWERLAREADIETLRKRIDATYVKNGEFKEYDDEDLRRWLGQRDMRLHAVLDFGCGLGRNFPTWRRIADTVVGYDLPAMIDRCRQLEPDVDLLTSDWSTLQDRQFSLIAAVLVLQHVAVGELREKLADMRRMTPLLLVSGRWYTDDGECDVLEIVLESGFVILASDFPCDSQGTRLPVREGDAHWTALFSSDVGNTPPGSESSLWESRGPPGGDSAIRFSAEGRGLYGR